MKVLKKNSEAWQLAKRRARRKGVNSVPVELSDDGQTVTLSSLIRDHTWKVSLEQLRLLTQR